jgi:hypothetical protein
MICYALAPSALPRERFSPLAHCGGLRQRGGMSAIEGKPDGRRTRPEPPLLTHFAIGISFLL